MLLRVFSIPATGDPAAEAELNAFLARHRVRTWTSDLSMPGTTASGPSNEQLTTLVRRRVQTRSSLESLEGFGPARLQRYGAGLLEALVQAIPALTGPDL